MEGKSEKEEGGEGGEDGGWLGGLMEGKEKGGGVFYRG